MEDDSAVLMRGGWIRLSQPRHSASLFLTKKRSRSEIPGNQSTKTRRMFGGRVWVDILVPEIRKVNPICGLSGRNRNMLILRPELEDDDRYQYASASVYCQRGDCTVSYSLTVKSRPVKEEMVVVNVDLRKGDPKEHFGEDGLPVDTYRRYLTGKERDQRRENLRKSHKTVTQFSQDAPAELEQAALASGNYSAIPSTKVDRNLQREIATEDRLDKDPVLELVLWRRNVLEEEGEPTVKCALRGHIQELIHSPFGFDVWDEDLLQICKTLLRSGKCRLFLDATGSVCRRLANEKDPYVYVAFLDPIDKPSIRYDESIFRFLTCAHNSERIRHFLSLWKESLQQRTAGDWLQVWEAVTDGSAAMIRGVCGALNHRRVWEYVIWAWEVIGKTKTKAVLLSLTALFLCGFHTLKSVPLGLARTRPDIRANTEYRKIIAKIIMCESWERLLLTVKALSTILSSEFETDLLRNCQETLNDNCIIGEEMAAEIERLEGLELDRLNLDLDEEDDWDPNDDKNEKPFSAVFLDDKPPSDPRDANPSDIFYSGDTQRARSPFFQPLMDESKAGRASAVLADAELGREEGTPVPNLTYNPKLLDYLEKEWWKTAPLWSGVMRERLRYATDFPDDQLPGPITPLYNNKSEADIRVLKTRDTIVPVQSTVKGLRASLPRVTQLAKNLVDSNRRCQKDWNQRRLTKNGKSIRETVRHRERNETKEHKEETKEHKEETKEHKGDKKKEKEDKKKEKKTKKEQKNKEISQAAASNWGDEPNSDESKPDLKKKKRRPKSGPETEDLDRYPAKAVETWKETPSKDTPKFLSLTPKAKLTTAKKREKPVVPTTEKPAKRSLNFEENEVKQKQKPWVTEGVIDLDELPEDSLEVARQMAEIHDSDDVRCALPSLISQLQKPGSYIQAEVLDFVSAQLKKSRPTIGSLQPTYCCAPGMQRLFQNAKASPFAQVLYYRNHFVVISDIFIPVEDRGVCILLYDSLQWIKVKELCQGLEDLIRAACCKILSLKDPSAIRIISAKINLQSAQNNCGPIAALNLMLLLEGENPEDYEIGPELEQTVRSGLAKMLEMDKLMPTGVLLRRELDTSLEDYSFASDDVDSLISQLSQLGGGSDVEEACIIEESLQPEEKEDPFKEPVLKESEESKPFLKEPSLPQGALKEPSPPSPIPAYTGAVQDTGKTASASSSDDDLFADDDYKDTVSGMEVKEENGRPELVSYEAVVEAFLAKAKNCPDWLKLLQLLPMKRVTTRLYRALKSTRSSDSSSLTKAESVARDWLSGLRDHLAIADAAPELALFKEDCVVCRAWTCPTSKTHRQPLQESSLFDVSFTSPVPLKEQMTEQLTGNGGGMGGLRCDKCHAETRPAPTSFFSPPNTIPPLFVFYAGSTTKPHWIDQVPRVLELTLMGRLVPYSMCLIGVTGTDERIKMISFDHATCATECSAVANFPPGYEHEKLNPRFIVFIAYH